ncbi:hypothetical protein BJY04DRAFT_172400 [Aspergillus karnatakaensis]|uniref:uncharacterized protein n=1 Tax=Aspergillus karnatakaensis TaxID=1810916 RepID=UPI003CCDF543
MSIDVDWHGFSQDYSGFLLHTFWSEPLGSLKQFAVLKTLELPIELLLGEAPWAKDALLDALPRTLERLVLKDGTVSWNPEMEIEQDYISHSLQDFINALSGYLPVYDQRPFLKGVKIDLANGPPLPEPILAGGNEAGWTLVKVKKLRALAEMGNVGMSMHFSCMVDDEQHVKKLFIYDVENREQEIYEIERN